MTSGPDPNQMLAVERVIETTSLLANGCLRLRYRNLRKNRSNFSSLSDNSLDFGRRQSVDTGVSGDLENPHAR
jgi:hypothetical protein